MGARHSVQNKVKGIADRHHLIRVGRQYDMVRAEQWPGSFRRSLHERVGPAPSFQGHGRVVSPSIPEASAIAGSPAIDALGRFRRRQCRIQSRLPKSVPVQPRIQPMIRSAPAARHRPPARLIQAPCPNSGEPEGEKYPCFLILYGSSELGRGASLLLSAWGNPEIRAQC